MPKYNIAVRSLPYPAIEDGNLSFPNGVYRVTPQSELASKTMVALRHEIEGSPFIQRLVEKGEAKFACTVSVPKTSYRRLHISKDGPEQKISWDLDVAGEPPMLGPVVLYDGDEDLIHKLTEQDGVAGAWQNQEFKMPKGARLAKARYLRPSLINSLLKPKYDESMKPGSFKIVEYTNDGFHFKLHAAKDIAQFCENPGDNVHFRDSIAIHAVSQCFNILKARYSASDEDDEEGEGEHWNQHRNLESLANLLASKGLPHWSEDGFDAVKVATELYPIRLPPIKE